MAAFASRNREQTFSSRIEAASAGAFVVSSCEHTASTALTYASCNRATKPRTTPTATSHSPRAISATMNAGFNVRCVTSPRASRSNRRNESRAFATRPSSSISHQSPFATWLLDADVVDFSIARSIALSASSSRGATTSVVGPPALRSERTDLENTSSALVHDADAAVRSDAAARPSSPSFSRSRMHRREDIIMFTTSNCSRASCA
mmetsp:Transcript_14591/g.52522  ORF Transcript_14591/g.52522 Transcript_14591/m.52522 type:complete len:206 (+) Transcript_14591:715-1332(+)